MNHYPSPTAASIATSTYELWCLIEGDSTPFAVNAPYATYTFELKRLIHKRPESGILQGVDARNLILKKVKVRYTTSSI
jgi:hypothetical protein